MHVHICSNKQGESTSDNQKRKSERQERGEQGKIIKSTAATATEKERKDGEIEWERKAMKHYLFWRPPSPPRSSEKFLRFHQHPLNHKEKRHSPISADWERRRERETEGGRQTESDSPLFNPLLLMATNLIICLHSRAAETCSLTYTLALAHSHTLLLSLSSLSLFLSPSP